MARPGCLLPGSWTGAVSGPHNEIRPWWPFNETLDMGRGSDSQHVQALRVAPVPV